jgi:hypothetical protein
MDGRFKAPHEIEVNGPVLVSKKILIDTGTRPRGLPIPVLDQIEFNRLTQIRKGRLEAGPGRHSCAKRKLGRALFHAVHGLPGRSSRAIRAAHFLHRATRYAVHHRTLVTRRIEGDVELLGKCGGDEADYKGGGYQQLLHNLILGLVDALSPTRC